MNRPLATILTTAAAAAVLSACNPSGLDVAPASSAELTMPADRVTGPYRVVSVVDGDTLWVQGHGQRLNVRLIGVDTPETKDPRTPVQCFGAEADENAHALLEGGQVFLEADASQGADRYGRTLAYVWLDDGRLVNLEQLAGGFAHEYTYDEPYRYRDQFVAAERTAHKTDVGLWNPTTCNGATDGP